MLTIPPIDPGDQRIDCVPGANRVGQGRHKPTQAAEDLGQHGSVAGAFDEHETTPLDNRPADRCGNAFAKDHPVAQYAQAFGFVGPVHSGHG
jgi:hypothetical protein